MFLLSSQWNSGILLIQPVLSWKSHAWRLFLFIAFDWFWKLQSTSSHLFSPEVDIIPKKTQCSCWRLKDVKCFVGVLFFQIKNLLFLFPPALESDLTLNYSSQFVFTSLHCCKVFLASVYINLCVFLCTQKKSSFLSHCCWWKFPAAGSHCFCCFSWIKLFMEKNLKFTGLCSRFINQLKR